ncbi:MAG: hypothetical protein IJI19_02960, partial [Ruminococcus sp.]|nr:hypothetical protein [Ruminococcus sp.]
GAFKVALFAQGFLVGESVVSRSILPGAIAEVTVNWIADVLPTGEYTLTALLDSEYNIVMSSRAGVRQDDVITVADGISVSIENDAAYLTQSKNNQVRVKLTRSDGKSNTEVASVRVMIAGTDLISNAVYDSSTDRYVASLDLSAVTLGEHSVIAVAEYNGMTDSCLFTANVVPSISVRIRTNDVLYETGGTMTVRGTTEGLSDGDTVEISLIGDQIWKYTAAVNASGSFTREIVLPANAGGAMRVEASVKNAGASRTASTDIYVYGAYFMSVGEVSLTAGDKTAVKGSVENIGYVDLQNVTVKASVRSLDKQNTDLPIIRFMSGGHAYVLTQKSIDLLEAVTEGVSVNGKGIAYNALDYNMQIDAEGCSAGDYEVVLTVTAVTDLGKYSLSKTISLTLLTPKAVMDINSLNKDYGDTLGVRTTAAPGETKTFSYRVVNLGTGNLTGLDAVLVGQNGYVIPWASIVMAGGVPSQDGQTTTIYPYYQGYDIGTAEGAVRISVTFAPQENIAAGRYDLTLIVSADDVETVEIPMTVYVSAHAIGTKVIKVVTTDGA